MQKTVTKHTKNKLNFLPIKNAIYIFISFIRFHFFVLPKYPFNKSPQVSLINY